MNRFINAYIGNHDTDARIINDSIAFSYRTANEYEAGSGYVHTHEFCELTFFIDGNVRFIAGDKSYIPESGDIFISPAFTLHGEENDGDAGSSYERFSLMLDIDTLDKAFGGDCGLAAFKQGKSYLLRLSERDKSDVLHMLRISEYAFGEVACPANPELFAYINLLRALWKINFCALSEDGSINAFARKAPAAIGGALEYIEKHYLSLDNSAVIADKLGVSYEYLSRTFHSFFGLTITQYLREKRIADAKKLLFMGRSVADTCADCGYISVSHFIKIFRESVGMTPAAYSRYALGKSE